MSQILAFNLQSDLSELTDETKSKLVHFGVDFATAFDCLINHPALSLNKKFRDFIRVVFYLNRDNQARKKDWELAEIVGCSRETIARTRKRFREWQERNSINLIEITDGDYYREVDGKIKKGEDGKPEFKFRPTEYKITFGKLLIEAIVEARETTLYSRNPYKAICEAIDRRINDLPINHDWSQGKRKMREPRPVSKEIETERKKIATSVIKVYGLADAQHGTSSEDELTFLHDFLEVLFDRYVDKIARSKGRYIPNLIRTKKNETRNTDG